MSLHRIYDLNGFAMMSIEREISKKIDFTEIFDQFAVCKAGKQQFIAKASHHSLKLITLTVCSMDCSQFVITIFFFLDNAYDFAPTSHFARSITACNKHRTNSL